MAVIRKKHFKHVNTVAGQYAAHEYVRSVMDGISNVGDGFKFNIDVSFLERSDVTTQHFINIVRQSFCKNFNCDKSEWEITLNMLNYGKEIEVSIRPMKPSPFKEKGFFEKKRVLEEQVENKRINDLINSAVRELGG